MDPILVEIDLSKTTKKGGYGIEVGPVYIALIGGRFKVGRFSKQHYGLCFGSEQYDPPGKNYSGFQRIWKISNAEDIAKEAETEYMKIRRDYAIKYKLESNGQKIDESAPLEAFAYNPKVSAMPSLEDDD